MPLWLHCLTAFAAILLSQGASAQSYPCRDQSRWLESVTSSQRDLVLLRISTNTARKFHEVVTQPNLKPDTELWAYKILAVGHVILSQSPYASTETKPLFLAVAQSTAGMISGEVKFSTFKNVMTAQMASIDQQINRKAPVEQPFMGTHKEEFERLSNCVLITAMYNASSEKGTN